MSKETANRISKELITARARSRAASEQDADDSASWEQKAPRVTVSDTGWSTPDEPIEPPQVANLFIGDGEMALTAALLERHLQAGTPTPEQGHGSSGGPPRIGGVTNAHDEGFYAPTAETIAAGMAMVGGRERYPPTLASIDAGMATVG